MQSARSLRSHRALAQVGRGRQKQGLWAWSTRKNTLSVLGVYLYNYITLLLDNDPLITHIYTGIATWAQLKKMQKTAQSAAMTSTSPTAAYSIAHVVVSGLYLDCTLCCCMSGWVLVVRPPLPSTLLCFLFDHLLFFYSQSNHVFGVTTTSWRRLQRRICQRGVPIVGRSTIKIKSQCSTSTQKSESFVLISPTLSKIRILDGWLTLCILKIRIIPQLIINLSLF